MPAPRLGCVDFGRKLILSGDLDPVYTLINATPSLRENRLKMERFLVAYWSFYHLGTSSWITDGGNEFYWPRHLLACQSKDYPRCPERRHYRGENALKSHRFLAEWRMESLMGPFRENREWTCKEVMKYVQLWVGFGPWIAFKAADMLERLSLARVRFDIDDVYLFDSPREGAKRLRASLRADVSDTDLNPWAINYLIEKLGDLPAPPLDDRPVGVQEAETVLCKWKSYLHGHFHIGEDTESCRKSLLGYSIRSKTAQEVFRAGRLTKLWT